MPKSTTKKKRHGGGNVKRGLFNGVVKDRWRAAFEYRVAKLAKHIYISCSEAMTQLRDDVGECPFSDCEINKSQWKLQRMFNQLEAKNFAPPGKDEIYVMLYEIYYGTKTYVTKLGVAVEIDPTPLEKVIIIRELLKMGGHYAPEKSEGKLTGKLIVEFGKGNLQPFIPDTKNRMKAYDN